ncbi:hypothetical protein Acr_03g0012810 [Actinidia rufa]|uniref:Uncharacterized protein n=1 Tax=Actinidia rufa TaxID=165716 RepID=A0A7J0EFV1_9ERIC|nr:hypothetical protein Acr_03g0012810 [Actinidia rufa]
MLEVLDLDPSRFNLSMTGFVVTRWTSDRPRRRSLAFDRPHGIRSILYLSFIVTRRTSNRLHSRLPDLRHALSSPFGLHQLSQWPRLTSATAFFIFVFTEEALTALALETTFFDRERPRRLWRVLDIAASTMCCGYAALLAISSGSTPIADQMAFAASGSSPRSSGVSIGVPASTVTPSSTTTLATSTHTAFHAKTNHPTWVLDSGVNGHMIDTPSFPGSNAITIPANLALAPLQVYTRRAPSSTPLPDSYSSLSASCQSFIGRVASIPIPHSVSEALQNPQWVATMQEEMDVLERNVSVVSQFMHVPRTSNLDVVHHILRYLKTCPGLGLFYIAKTQDETVDMFTKLVGPSLLKSSLIKLGLIDILAPT